MKEKILTALSGLLAAALLLTGCEGSATQTTNSPSVSGILVDPQGNPAAEVQVAAWRAGGLSPIGPGSLPVAMTRTDAKGYYALEVETGTYNLFGQSGRDSLAVGMPGVVYASGDLDLGVRALMPPGAVTGRVLAAGVPAREAFCFIPGSAFVAMTDDSGRFALGQVPPGTYLLRYVKSGYRAAEESVTVVSDSVLSLPDRDLSPDVTLQPPVPEGLRASEDTATGFVTLTWNPVRVEDLEKYVVETRATCDPWSTWSPIEPLQVGLEVGSWTDTARVDRDARREFAESEDLLRGTGPLDSCLLEYRVKAVDRDGNSSPTYSKTLSVVLRRPPSYNTQVEVALLGGTWDSVRCNDTLALAVSFANPVLDSASFHWSVHHKVQRGSTFHTLYNPNTVGLQPIKARTDSLRWWWGKGLDADMAIKMGPDNWSTPDSLYIKVKVDPGPRFSAKERVIDIVRPEPGCFLLRPARMRGFGE